MLKVGENKGITLIALVISIIVLLILAGVTINAISGSDSSPAKANEAGQKNDIGAAKDDISLTVTNAQMEAYESVYVEGKQTGTNEAVTAENASTNVGTYVRKKVYEKYKASEEFKTGLASIVATEDGQITISTTDFKEYGLIDLSGGALSWITPVPITTLGTITASSTEVKETKTITLTAVINSDATESLTWKSSDDTIAIVTSTGKNTATVTGLAGQKGNSVTITASYGDLTPVTIEITVIENVVESYVGKYVDIDGVNGVDGIIYADLLAQKPTGDWNDSNGHYELPPAEAEANYRTYEISLTNQVPKKPTDSTKNLFDATGRDVVKLASGNQDGKSKRFYVMQLSDYNNGATYQWSAAKDLTATTTVGTITYSWKCPTKEEWSMFGKAFNYNTGLSNIYWSSTQLNSNLAWCADFFNWKMIYTNGSRYVRLCTTF